MEWLELDSEYLNLQNSNRDEALVFFWGSNSRFRNDFFPLMF